MMRKMSKHIDISLPKYKWGKCHCHDCEEGDIMWEKAKVYIPLPDNVRPKSSLKMVDELSIQNFMGMTEDEFETFMNRLLHETSGDEDEEDD